MIYFLVFSVLIIFGIISPLFRTFTREKERKYALFGDHRYQVNQRELQEIPYLEKQLLNTNKYCKKETIALYFTVKRAFPSEVEAQKQQVLSVCEDIVLHELDYAFSIDTNEPDELLPNHPELCRFIEKKATEQVKRITGEEDKSFYISNLDAWEIRLYHLQEAFVVKQVDAFYQEICKLAALNNDRVTIERKIYFQSYQFLVQTNREYSLRFYLHYLNVKTFSDNYKHYKISVKNRKILFKKTEDNKKFDAICTSLLKHKKLEEALEQLDQMQISQRKKISLNMEAIKMVAEKQSKVANVLGEWLAEEEERNIIPVKESTGNHKVALLQLFIDRSFRVNKEEVDIFARPRGLFSGQFIERINEEHYEELDDVLIEEENDYYIMNEAYYQQIAENGN